MSWGVSSVIVDYPEHRALCGVTLAAPRGEVTAIVGGDGSGKTTLIELLAGRIIPTVGRVERPDDRLIGLQPSSSGVWRQLSVAENMTFAGEAYRLPRTVMRERTDALLARAGLAGATGRLGGELSGGMRQKLGFAMAMLHAPDLVLLDEPTTGVDPVSRVELWRLISQAAADGAAIVMATTYLDEAERAGRVLVLDEGHAIGGGSPDDVLTSVPGLVTTATERQAETERSWRRGAQFHAWFAPGDRPSGEVIQPDMEDAVIALTMARRSEAGAA